MPEIGDYVLATKYSDGDPGDQYAVGYLKETFEVGDCVRYLVVDNDGLPFRANGFRRCETITHERGVWLIAHFPDMVPLKVDDDGNVSGKSVWEWAYEAMT